MDSDRHQRDATQCPARDLDCILIHTKEEKTNVTCIRIRGKGARAGCLIILKHSIAFI